MARKHVKSVIVDDEVNNGIRALAKYTGISITELILRALKLYLGLDPRVRNFAENIGKIMHISSGYPMSNLCSIALRKVCPSMLVIPMVPKKLGMLSKRPARSTWPPVNARGAK